MSTAGRHERRRAALERRLRERFHVEVRVVAPAHGDTRAWLWARLPGAIEATRFEPPIRAGMFDGRSEDELFAVASAIVADAFAAATEPDPMDVEPEPDADDQGRSPATAAWPDA
jgi:hypothetical protein